MYHLTLDVHQLVDLRIALGVYCFELDHDANCRAGLLGTNHPVVLGMVAKADRFRELLSHIESSTAPADATVAGGCFDGTAGAAGGAE